MRIVFAGTPEFACPALQWLLDSGRPPAAVLTQPDRPAGRGRRLSPSPVKQLAVAHSIPVLQPESLRGSGPVRELDRLRPDLLVTAAYGLLLPTPILDLPGHGCWNLHASLLPRWRGASPIQQAILAGDRETGISLMRMEAGLDTGPVYLRRTTAIGPTEAAGSLHDRLARLAAEALAEAIEHLEQGTLPEPEPQDDRLATHAPLIRKSDGRLDWSLPAEQLARQVRAYNPWPVAWGEVGGETIRVFEAWPEPDAPASASPGQLLGCGNEAGIRVACGRGVLEITELQVPGRKRVSAAEFLNARPDWR